MIHSPRMGCILCGPTERGRGGAGVMRRGGDGREGKTPLSSSPLSAVVVRRQRLSAVGSGALRACRLRGAPHAPQAGALRALGAPWADRHLPAGRAAFARSALRPRHQRCRCRECCGGSLLHTLRATCSPSPCREVARYDAHVC